MMRAILLIISVLLVAWPAAAATYTYNISFGDPSAYIQATGVTMPMLVTGTVITDCDNCTVYNPIYWSFTGNGAWTISSTDVNAHLTYSLPTGVLMPLTATPTGLYWNFNYHYADGAPYQNRWDGSDPYICFCVYLSPYDPKAAESHKLLMFGANPGDFTVYFFLYATDPQNPDLGFAHWADGNMLLGQLAPAPLSPSSVPLPGALPLFATGLAGLGLLGWRRKRKAQAAA